MQEQLTRYIKGIITVKDEELDKILSFFKPMKVEKNELLVIHGQTSQRTFFVGNGCLRIFFITEDGQEVTRYLAFENNFATALCSFISKEPSLEFIQALEPTSLLYISHKDFYHLLEIIPSWENFYRHYLENAYVNNTNRLMSFLTLDATERYRQLLSTNPKIVQRLPNKIVATYLNISQETLSRLKSKI
ncbi:Crp/Fnr family transcriptional regulator [Ferruginibacter sp. HRS2-29]|uniref:Crp/Fnr family transcriptional regulator n=1 Tax=Ferruginibacter sp. HRS2-29 TaxID=2487334 RepID=UPI0020CE3C83|nr:Crp/Fnr family transcriptional regulator [Ferruginibacter sp. HRS2-29]MCP9752666.1 Crp/Fnr family transcriptional regulator [Ferruginibacter sp. HRS2-29]